ncbi:type II toxin-antitoxin system RelE/ParE family toxin [Pantoea tagorei]
MSRQDAELTFIYLPTVRLSIEEIAAFQRKLGNEPTALIQRALDEFEQRVAIFPEGCPICSELLGLGISRYRECHNNGGYRILYSLTPSDVFVHVLLSPRQSIQNLLFRRLLLV